MTMAQSSKLGAHTTSANTPPSKKTVKKSLVS